MNKSKLKQLFAAARCAPSMEPPSNFPALVMAAARQSRPERGTASVAEALATMFPRLVAASLIIVALCVAAELFFEPSTENATDVSQITEQWFFTAE